MFNSFNYSHFIGIFIMNCCLILINLCFQLFNYKVVLTHLVLILGCDTYLNIYTVAL